MLPRRMRLPRARFAPASTGKRATSVHFSVTVRERPGEGGCAVVISKKVAKRATERNRLKRRIQAVVRAWCNPDRSVIIYARLGSPTLPYSALTEELTALLNHVIGRTSPVR